MGVVVFNIGGVIIYSIFVIFGNSVLLLEY